MMIFPFFFFWVQPLYLAFFIISTASWLLENILFLVNLWCGLASTESTFLGVGGADKCNWNKHEKKREKSSLFFEKSRNIFREFFPVGFRDYLPRGIFSFIFLVGSGMVFHWFPCAMRFNSFAPNCHANGGKKQRKNKENGWKGK